MIYILEFVFNNNEKKVISYTRDKEITENSINELLNCDFINSITDCEPNNTYKDVKYYDNIKIPFSRQTFIDYLNNKNYLELFSFSNFFGNNETTTKIITKELKGKKKFEKIKLFNLCPLMFEILLHDKSDLITGIVKNNEKYYDELVTVKIKNEMYQKRYVIAAAIIRDKTNEYIKEIENKKLNGIYLFDLATHSKEIHGLKMTNNLRADSIHTTKITKIVNGEYTDINVSGSVIVHSGAITEIVYNLDDGVNKIKLAVICSRTFFGSRYEINAHNNKKDNVLVVNYDYSHTYDFNDIDYLTTENLSIDAIKKHFNEANHYGNIVSGITTCEENSRVIVNNTGNNILIIKSFS